MHGYGGSSAPFDRLARAFDGGHEVPDDALERAATRLGNLADAR